MHSIEPVNSAPGSEWETSKLPACAGGPPLRGPDQIGMRWLGNCNYEICYDGSILLVDTWYDRGPRNRPIGITVDQVRHADAIFIGHAHWDHMADVVPVANQTGAPVYGNELTLTKALADGLHPSQAHLVRDGDRLEIGGVQVDFAVAHHAILDPAVHLSVSELLGGELDSVLPRDDDVRRAEAAIAARGSTDPKIMGEGVLALVFTFPNGFRIGFLDSAGPVTASLQRLMDRLGGTDIALVAYQTRLTSQRQCLDTLPLVKLFNPALAYIPIHHDALGSAFFDHAVYPIAMALQDELPGVHVVAPLYGTPIHVDIEAKRIRSVGMY